MKFSLPKCLVLCWNLAFLVANHLLGGDRHVIGEFLLDCGDLALHLDRDVSQSVPKRRGGRRKIVRNSGGKSEKSLNLKKKTDLMRPEICKFKTGSKKVLPADSAAALSPPGPSPRSLSPTARATSGFSANAPRPLSTSTVRCKIMGFEVHSAPPVPRRRGSNLEPHNFATQIKNVPMHPYLVFRASAMIFPNCWHYPIKHFSKSGIYPVNIDNFYCKLGSTYLTSFTVMV